MKDFGSLFIVLVVIHLILTSTGGNPTPVWREENVSFPMMNQEIRHSVEENDRQKNMKDLQNENLISEMANKKQWENFKKTSTKIQDRLRFVSYTIQAIPTGIAITREAQKIKNIQTQILNEINTAPYSIAVVLPNQIQFVDDLQMVIRLLTGLVVSYGAINQMEKSERKILLDYALAEVEQLTRSSTFMLMKIRNIKDKVHWRNATLNYYVNRDKKLVQDILKGIKNF
ncbi:hypothetical protein [Cloacibacterium normanense]|uniref:hypothetical protein n=1 Tax=Cloacibacterium normanense TaxID=237258 RepID=UPI00391A9CEB